MRPLLLLICGGTAAVVAIRVERRGAGIEAVPSCVAGAARRRGAGAGAVAASQGCGAAGVQRKRRRKGGARRVWHSQRGGVWREPIRRR